jgi:uncharacterized Zn finger protein (UPF0148 family)
MKRKNPEDLLIDYPSKRARPGTRTTAQRAASLAGHKTFAWHCPTHGQALFSTSGSGTCRQCIADAQRASRARLKAANTATAAPAALDPETQTRQDYAAAMASKNNHQMRDQKLCTS